MIWSRPKLRVLFVCTANVCRSPLAEGLLRHRLRELGLADLVQVRSAGTHAVQRNRRPDPRVEELAAERGVSLTGIRARMITPKLMLRSDYVLVMERRHLEDVTRQCRDFRSARSVFALNTTTEEDCSEKIQLLGNFLPDLSGAMRDIPDPYFGDLQAFHYVYEMIDSAITGLLDEIGTHLEEIGRSR